METPFYTTLTASENAKQQKEFHKRLKALFEFIPMEEWNNLIKKYPEAETWFDDKGEPL